MEMLSPPKDFGLVSLQSSYASNTVQYPESPPESAEELHLLFRFVLALLTSSHCFTATAPKDS